MLRIRDVALITGMSYFIYTERMRKNADLGRKRYADRN